MPALTLTGDPVALKRADFFIVTVPTPIDDARRPDLGAMLAASKTVGAALQARATSSSMNRRSIPARSRKIACRCWSKASGLKAGTDFTSAIRPSASIRATSCIASRPSPRSSPGRMPRRSTSSPSVYGSVVTAGVHRAPSIKVAEAAKVIENTQRDLNIAFMNELSLIFQSLGIDTGDVLAAAGTKWNFLPFQPGLVGGHCIGVDPYYLTLPRREGRLSSRGHSRRPPHQ